MLCKDLTQQTHGYHDLLTFVATLLPVFANAGPLAWLPVPALQHLVVEQQSLQTMRSWRNLDKHTEQDAISS